MNTSKWDVLLVNCGVSIVDAHKWSSAFSSVITDEVMPKQEVFAFLGQVLWESEYLRRVEENLDYSSARLIELFPRRITVDEAQKYGRNVGHGSDPQMIANIIYGGEWGSSKLGNTQEGDGWKFRGAGPFQITGRRNVEAASKWTEIPFVEKPELLKIPGYEAVEACVWYWETVVGGRWSDPVARRKAINGGILGLQETVALTRRVESAWNALGF
jgi:putative chitinase